MPELPLPELDGTSLVLVGAFNPRIFHPAWFVRNGLLPEGTESSANVEIVNNDVCAFETDSFRLEVLSDRLMLQSMSAPAAESLRDLLVGTFRILRHTPVKLVGLNTHGHYMLRSEEAWHEFGHLLAPKEPLWSPILERPGTISVVMQGVRTDGFDGAIRVKVEPSTRVANGIFIDTNDEFRQLESDSADWIDDVLNKQWEASRARVDEIRANILLHAYGGDTK
jgi:hypothetical protein